MDFTRQSGAIVELIAFVDIRPVIELGQSGGIEAAQVAIRHFPGLFGFGESVGAVWRSLIFAPEADVKNASGNEFRRAKKLARLRPVTNDVQIGHELKFQTLLQQNTIQLVL